MSDSSAFDVRTTPAPWEQRQEWLLLEMKQKLEDVIYKEQVNQLWKLGMESMMHSVWAKVCAECVTVSVGCQTDEQVEHVCDRPTSPGCATCLHGTVTSPPEEESGFGFGIEEDIEQKSEENPTKRSLERNFFSQVNEGDGCDVSVPVGSFSVAENGSSPPVVTDADQEEQLEPDSRPRSENIESYQCAHCEAKFSRKDEFSRHQQGHLNSIKRYNKKCQLCLRIFKHQQSLTNHTNAGTCQRKPVKSRFKCLECATSFETHALFRRHSLSHKEKKYVCTVCGKAYHFPSQLNEHMLIHGGRKPHYYYM